LSRINTMTLSPVISAILACAMSVGAAHAEDPVCKTVFDAGETGMQTPNHQYVTQTGGTFGSTGHRSEIIHTIDASYVLVDGQWHRSRLDMKAMREQEQENRRNTKNARCAHVRDDAVDGEAAGVFSAHYESEYAKVDALIWISSSSGLTLREELDMDAGELGKTHSSVRTRYAGVQAPVGVN
jgi:hypothetical protein